jgi:hypothetical protein
MNRQESTEYCWTMATGQLSPLPNDMQPMTLPVNMYMSRHMHYGPPFDFMPEFLFNSIHA